MGFVEEKPDTMPQDNTTHCLRSGQVEVVKCMITHLVDTDLTTLDYLNDEKKLPSPFWYATREGHIEIMKLFERHTYVRRGHRGATPISLAAHKGNREVLGRLLYWYSTGIGVGVNSCSVPGC